MNNSDIEKREHLWPFGQINTRKTRQLRDHAIGQSPQHGAIGTEQINSWHIVPTFEIERLPPRGIGEMCKRRPENIAYLVIGRNFNAFRNRINKTGHLDGQRRARDIVQTTEILRVAQIETEFLAGLALSRVFEILDHRVRLCHLEKRYAPTMGPWDVRHAR